MSEHHQDEKTEDIVRRLRGLDVDRYGMIDDLTCAAAERLEVLERELDEARFEAETLRNMYVAEIAGGAYMSPYPYGGRIVLPWEKGDRDE